MKSQQAIEKELKTRKAEMLCAVSFIMIALFTNVIFAFVKMKLDINLWKSSPMAWNAAIDAISLVLMLFGTELFSFLRFKFFACAGFFGYAAYCVGSQTQMWLAITAWVLAGILAVRLPLWASIILGAICVAAMACWNWTFYSAPLFL